MSLAELSEQEIIRRNSFIVVKQLIIYIFL